MAPRRKFGRDITQVITNDLGNCGLFRPLPQSSFIQAGQSQGDVPDFKNWASIGAQALVTGKAEVQPGGNLRVEFRLWDVLPQTQIQGTAYTTTQSNWRRIAHIIADVIYRAAAGREGLFRYPHRLYLRHRAARPPHQAAGDHGPGQREQPLPDRRHPGWC